MVLTGSQMLDHLGYGQSALAIEQAVIDVIARGEVTRDLGGELGTRAVGDALVARLRDPAPAA